MGTEVPNGGDGGTQSSDENDLLQTPVSLDMSGEGLPYAPADWPNPGDNWGWKVGKRVSLAGHYVDRYLYLPKRLRASETSSRKGIFASKLSVARYVEEKFPDADIDAFFASFSWKIPANRRGSSANGHMKGRATIALPTDDHIELSLFDSDQGGCKAGNKTCSSLVEQVDDSTIIDCDICCVEPRFCRECCCILCCRSVDSDYGGYSYIKCEAVVEEGRVCAHLAHISCALRSYMAGKVGGSIGLDAEYYCRRCDAKTDLVSHVTKLLESCESSDSRDDVEKMLKVGFSILRDSERSNAKGLLGRIELAISKLNNGVCLEDIWKVEDNSLTLTTDITQHGNTEMEIVTDQDPLDVQTDFSDISAPFDWLTESLKLEEEIDQVLQALRKSQEIEYKLAEDRLYDQKNYLSSLYQQLEIERSELTCHPSPPEQENLLSVVLNRVDQIKREVAKLKDMEKVASGFGKTSRGVLEEHFGLEIEG